MDTIIINGVEYVPKDQIPSTNADGLPYVVVRSRESGCHAGYLLSREGANVTLKDSRRLWYWKGAATLSQLAEEGVKNPSDCKFPQTVSEIKILGCCEIITATEAARESIEKVPVWKK